VSAGEAATAPADPKREGYAFIGWDKDFLNVTEDMTITAQYEDIFSADFDGIISAKVHNDTDGEIKGMIVASVYNENGVLTVLEKTNFQASAGDIYEAEFGIDLNEYPKDSYTYKVFFWDEAYVPLTGAITGYAA
jgi:uncharacterized repeat protein (TIGR02543 family)